MEVQPYKCGPDYIDTKFHQLATGNPSINLDLFFSSPEKLISLYKKYTDKKNVCVTEGVMGLFDGYDKMQGSSAQIAGLLDLPVVLVVDARSMAYSVAPLLYGFRNFQTDIHITGVIFNFVSSENHYRFLKEACSDVGMEALGYLPKDNEIHVPSRHLGLCIDEQTQYEEFTNRISALMEKYVDIDKLIKLTERPVEPSFSALYKNNGTLNIAVAKDQAFNFIYHENIEHLKKFGQIVFFSPVNDSVLPESDLVYLPGGYPELYLKELSSNKSMMNDIKKYAGNNGKILAECGGMMYLSSSITDSTGNIYPMAGILDQAATMEHMKLKLGYRHFDYNGLTFKGHEFHYSTIDNRLNSIAQQYNAKNIPVDTKLIRYKNVIAGYTHIYWADMDNILEIFN